ncbi:1,5-anhydro-D-fructose reductase-like isoform X2 [Zootermopsis nevadensis]|uniref:1,5-anhydro-D-fructose reductase-like isoform X2 n=1 Tax=Zootermopsis nevadensis TaxID=136037 RepID=UPI000B8E2AD8|nr:1,5-anhydro-D-fructose reductase-like isoform X2 [Zootermopsis nevadensis]
MVPTVKLNNNQDFPVLGLGTYTAEPGEMKQVVKDAIDAGYRHFDTALFYRNEKEVGAAIRAKIADGTITRNQVFVTTKLWNTHHRPDVVVPTLKTSLENLGLEYVDLYLIHWPFGFKEGDNGLPEDAAHKLIYSDVDYVDTWKTMEDCVRLRLTKSIGLSNFNSKQIQRVLDVATIKPVVNQIECHPYLNQTKLIKFCKEKGIVVTGYSPFGGPTSIAPLHKGESPEPLKDPKIKEVADKYGKTTAQIILRYLIQHGIVPIPKSSNKNRLQENIDIFNFELVPEDVAAMDALNRNKRICDFIQTKDHKHYPFNIQF